MAQTPIQIQAHPPERRQRGGVVLYGTCCCSCCCCCLHVLGGLMGAMMGSAPPNKARTGAPPLPEAFEKFQPSAAERVTKGPDGAIASHDSGLTETAPPAETPLQLDPLPEIRDVPEQRLLGTELYCLTVLVLTVISCVGVGFYFGNPGAR